MSEYDWHPVVMLRWSTEGKLQQHWKRRVSNKRGIWYDEFEWREVPSEQPAQETIPAPEASILQAFSNSPRRVQETFACLGGCGASVPSKDAYCSACFLRERGLIVPKGHFWRGEPELNRLVCRNCGEHYDKHLHTDEASRCPETGVRCSCKDFPGADQFCTAHSTANLGVNDANR